MDELQQLKTGTTTVGLVCKDGIILAADKRATAGNLIVDKKAEKTHILNDDCAVTIAGSVSEAQLLIKLSRAELKLKEMRTNKKTSAKEAANLIGGLLYSNIRKYFPGVAHFLLGAKDHKGVHLYDLFPDGSVTEITDYVSSGSGSVFAYGVLESQYKNNLSVQDGLKLVVRCITASMARDNYSGNGIDVVIVGEKEIRRLMPKEIEALQ